MAETKQKTGTKPSKRVLDKRYKKRAGESNEPTKEEYAVARYVRFNCPTKTTTFGHGSSAEDVKYFVGSKAVDALLDSKWSSSSKKASKKTQPLFTDRRSCVDYMQELLMKGLFFRAKKLVPKMKEKVQEGESKKKDRKEPKEEAVTKSPKEGAVKRRGKEKDQKEEEEKARKEEDEDGNEKGKEKTSKARKVRLDFHGEQMFIDGPSIYVWKYDPTSTKAFLLGLGIVLGAIGLCLFPLWPPQIRIGVYYLSLGAMGLFGVFIGLVILRSVLFGVGWLTTLGRHHFWLLPNLTEDCGVMESFKPLYSYKYVPSGSKSSDDKKDKKKKQSESDDEAEKETKATNDDAAAEPGSGTESEHEEEAEEEEAGQDGESLTGSQSPSDSEQSDGSQNEDGATHSSADEAATSSKEKEIRKRRTRVDDGSNNGDFEFVEGPNNGP